MAARQEVVNNTNIGFPNLIRYFSINRFPIVFAKLAAIRSRPKPLRKISKTSWLIIGHANHWKNESLRNFVIVSVLTPLLCKVFIDILFLNQIFWLSYENTFKNIYTHWNIQTIVGSRLEPLSCKSIFFIFVFVLMGWSLLSNALWPFQDLLCSPELRY